MTAITPVQEAIREEKLDGWLFCNFAHRDRLTDTLLSLNPGAVSSRRWFYLVPATGTPEKIVHAIEKDILDSLEGAKTVYSSRDELELILRRFAGTRIAVLCDPDIQVLSTMDAASFNLLHSCGIETASAACLVQRVKGILDEAGISSHEKSARLLYGIVHDAWHLVNKAFKSGSTLYEGDIRDFMLSRFAQEGLVTDHDPIVGTGPNTGNPHYTVEGRGRSFRAGDVVQFDLWAKYPDGIYADISWLGYCGTVVPEETQKRFDLVIAARDLVRPAIEEAFAAGLPVNGASLDARVRKFLLDRCPKEAVQHRTGHGIDTDCHGSGTNLDSVEFPDTRRLLEGSCFSVEPGIYFADCGFRTEIDIYIHHGKPVVSGGDIQTTLLTLKD